ncbi:ferredoxin reductase [Amycolatopsis jiangsuensis]|uniref:Ferredoxin-NADP reductase n=1 Tax=Amycolatopsis jiangsuensis TaxID=1181879 RepID=A0A840IV12_9PSEU|nr:ferredoxin reductase [Amycolatopsis jiangsuensis]MBB4685710.1 ferredoxin-NADP reductase [Amycolatopsis jiangsuensis]
MAGTAVSGRLAWQVARLAAIRQETATARTLVFDIPGWPGHLAGQHVDVRLTAADGYTAQRSYSLAAPAEGGRVELTVQRVPGGEVSEHLTGPYAIGDPVEIRGPIGGWFVWRPADRAPVLLVAGGAGIVPLMAMVRARRAAGSRALFRLVYSLRTPDELYYADELRKPYAGLDITYVYTREMPEGRAGIPRRLDVATLNSAAWPADFEATSYICGPTGFVETAADILLSLGRDPRSIRTERFGPSRD